MGTVEQSHLALVVRRLAGNEQHVQAGFVCREFFCDLGRGLDYPEVEDFRLVQQIVLVSNPLAELLGSVAGIARHDAVHQSGIHATGGLEPVAESFAKVPKIYILEDALLQVFAVLKNQLAGEDYETFALVALEILVTVIQQLGQLAGIGACGSVGKLAGGIERDAGLGGIGDHETHLGLLCKGQICLEIFVGVEASGHHIYQIHTVHRLAVLQALEVEVI